MHNMRMLYYLKCSPNLLGSTIVKIPGLAGGQIVEKPRLSVSKTWVSRQFERVALQPPFETFYGNIILVRHVR